MTAPQPGTVDFYAQPYGNILVPVPRQGARICRVCRSGCGDGYSHCPRCGRDRTSLDAAADAVGLIALAPASGPRRQLGYELLHYKRQQTPESTRRDLSIRMAAVLWKWLPVHRECLARAAGVDDFAIITSVPSSNRQRPGEHPLVSVVSRIVQGSGEQYRDLLRPTGIRMGEHDYRSDRFSVADRLDGAPVLVIDDRWTSGAQLQGASHALKSAGAGPVAVLAIGRHYYPDDAWNVAVEEQLRGRAWSWDVCNSDG